MKVREAKQLLKYRNQKVTWIKKRKLFMVINNGQVSMVSEVKKTKPITI